MNSVGKTLTVAHRSHDLVRVRRAGLPHEEGFVAGLGRKWLLLATIDDGAGWDGWRAVRLRDVSRVAARPRRPWRRAMKLAADWPPPTPDFPIDLDRTRGLIRSMADRYPLITLHFEQLDPDVCYIGRPQTWRRHRLELAEITPKARWKFVRWYRFRDITRVDADGRYERMLSVVSDSSS